MKDFRLELKGLAKAKAITAADMYQLCLFKAMTAKNATSFEDRVEIAYNLVTRAFTPITNKNKLYCSGYPPYWGAQLASSPIKGWVKNEETRFWSRETNELWSCLETEEEINQFKKLSTAILPMLGSSIAKKQEQYTYIFVREDMPREYQLVQTSHVTFELGAALKSEGISFDGLNFVVCHAPDENTLIEYMGKIKDFGYKTISFTEPDIGNETTAIATWPINYRDKHCMKDFNLLRFGE